MQVGIGPPDVLMVAVDILGQEGKVPPGRQGRTSGCKHDDYKDVVQHNQSQRSVYGTVDPGNTPDTDIQQRNGDLSAPKAKLVKKNGPPGGPKKTTALVGGDEIGSVKTLLKCYLAHMAKILM